MEPSPERQPTLDEVAARAGVSRTAASRVINNAPHVSRAKREAVQRAVRELDFVPNPSAQALATRRVGAVVLAISSDEPGLFADPFFAEVIVRRRAALEQTELELILLLANTPRGRERFERLLRSRRADGVMLMALRGDDPLGRLGEEADLPVVFGGLPLVGEPRGTWTPTTRAVPARRPSTCSHAAGLGWPRSAGAWTPRRGVRGIGATGMPCWWPVSTVPPREGDFTESGGAAAMAALLAAPGPDGVFAATDNMAVGALRTLRGRAVGPRGRRGGRLRRPGDRPDHRSAADHGPPARPGPGAGDGAHARRAIDGQDPSPLILPTRLVVRSST